jgi:heme-degrading monooxygenase HmoA
MIARVTTADVDTVRTSSEGAVAVFRESVLPALREQPGYQGAYVLLSPEGKALVLTFWATEEDANEGLAGARSFYAEQVAKFATIYRSPPGRDAYEVVVAEAPAVAVT